MKHDGYTKIHNKVNLLKPDSNEKNPSPFL